MADAVGRDLGLSPLPAIEEDKADPKSIRQYRSTARRRPRTLVPVPDVDVDEPADDEVESLTDGEVHEAEIATLVVESRPTGEYLEELLLARGLDDPTLRLRELTEIERMRDLEIARLEQELAERADTIFDLETALFHAVRRGDDLDRRWNELASTYEQTAERLVEAGGRLESIEHQAGYSAMQLLVRLVRRQPAVYGALKGFARRLLFGPTD